jgi:hypothetical protein
MIAKLQGKLKEYIDKTRVQFFEILKSETSDHSVALGFSIGTFVCVLPLFGLHIVICILLGLFFKKLNKVALALSVIFWNPLMEFLIYFLSFRIGTYFYTESAGPKFDIVFLNQIYDFSMRFLLGNIIIAITFAILSYFVIRLVLLINRKFVKREFAEINSEAVESKEKEQKIEHHDNKIEINVVHHNHEGSYQEEAKTHNHLEHEHTNPKDSHHLQHHDSKKQDFVDLSKIHEQAEEKNR